eukprot:6191929-Pleurochrysis_carterae.AAC.1
MAKPSLDAIELLLTGQHTPTGARYFTRSMLTYAMDRLDTLISVSRLVPALLPQCMQSADSPRHSKSSVTLSDHNSKTKGVMLPNSPFVKSMVIALPMT